MAKGPDNFDLFAGTPAAPPKAPPKPRPKPKAKPREKQEEVVFGAPEPPKKREPEYVLEKWTKDGWAPVMMAIHAMVIDDHRRANLDNYAEGTYRVWHIPLAKVLWGWHLGRWCGYQWVVGDGYDSSIDMGRFK